jgi:hypothetical protein
MFDRRQLLAGTVGTVFAQPALTFAADKSDAASALACIKAAFGRHSASIQHFDRAAVADFSLESSVPRFHLVDLDAGRIQSFLVAHGKGSDPDHTGWLKSFSNRTGSEATSEGAYLTADAYEGKHGASRRLIGLDAGNSNALSRAIVIHGAWYVNDEMAHAGKLGRSQGCFALSERDRAAVMEALGQGRIIVATRLQG